jgi:hypothetical protein
LNHFTSSSFWTHFDSLPTAVQRLARLSFERLKADPRHPSLHFKKVGRHWSARVGSNYRAVAKEVDDGMLWIWIGTHAEYDTIVRG